MRGVRVVVAVLLFGAPPLAAQGSSCEPADTVADCIAKLEGRVPQAVEERSAARLTTRLQSHATGLGVGPAAASISDFLPLFAGMLAGGPGDAGQLLAAEYNLRLDFDPARPGAQVVRLRVLRHEAEVFPPLAEAIPDSVRDARVEQLTSAMGEFDDVEVRLAWNLETGAFGRQFGQYRQLAGDLFSAIVAEAERAAAPALQVTARVSTLLNELEDDEFASGCDPDLAGDPATLELRCLREGPRARLVDALRATVLSETRLDSVVGEALTDGGFFRLADLVNNQPQLSVEAHGRVRDDRAGPDRFGGTVRFELGFANVNRFRGYCKREGMTVDARCLREYLALPGVVRALGRGDRLWISVDVGRTTDWTFALPADGATRSVAGPWAVTAAAGFGRYVGETADRLEAGRIDLDASYVFRADDAVRENRAVANLTYTHRVSDNASVVLGLTWASEPEFLAAVDEKVSATFGIRYGLARDGAR